jgi:hypothetical protein
MARYKHGQNRDFVLDTETGTWFNHESDLQEAKEFAEWLKDGNLPDLAEEEVLPTEPAIPPHLQVDEDPLTDDDVLRALADLRAFFHDEAPTPEFTAATVRTLIRLHMHDKLR